MILLGMAAPANAAGKASLYGVYMVPHGREAEDYSRPGWGAGARIVVPVPETHRLLAGVAGLEIVNLLSETVRFQDAVTSLVVENRTDQNYGRFFIGAEFGPHGPGFLRPYVGADLALAFYWIDANVVIPDDHDPENSIVQDLDSETHTVFGYDLAAGLDWNIKNKFTIDTGIRFVKSFSVPQQLWEGSETVHPEYFQVYIGLGWIIPELGG